MCLCTTFYIQGNGVFTCKCQGSHKCTRSGQHLGLNNNALSCVWPNFLSERDFPVLCIWCRTEGGEFCQCSNSDKNHCSPSKLNDAERHRKYCFTK